MRSSTCTLFEFTPILVGREEKEKVGKGRGGCFVEGGWFFLPWVEERRGVGDFIVGRSGGKRRGKVGRHWWG